MTPAPALAIFFGLLIIGMPVYLTLGIISAILFWLEGSPLLALPQFFVDTLKSDTLTSIPFFVIAATFMQRGGISNSMIDLAQSMLGRVRGGLALVCVAATMVFSAISGSSVATALAMGTVLVPAMLERRYEKHFALGVVGASGTLGILIPPSLAMIVYGVVVEQSIPQLFLAGVIPGILQALFFVVWIIFYTQRKRYPLDEVALSGNQMKIAVRALPGLMLPVIVLGGIYSGIVTVNESAGVAALAAIVIALVFYKGCKLREVPRILAESMQLTAVIYIIILGALAFGHWITASGMANSLVAWAQASDLSAWQFLLAINLIMLILGMFLETVSVILIVVPLVFPLLAPLGINPIHFAVIIVVNMEIALLTPPVGLNLFVLSTISDAPIATTARGVLPFIVLMLILLMLITFVPQISTFLPEYVYGR